MRSRLLRVAALALLAFVACESPFEPQGLGERVPVGQVITDDVRRDTVARYSFVSEAGGPYVVFLDALEGAVTMGVFDSTRQTFVAYLAAGPSSPPLYENPTPTFLTRPGDVYQIIATTLGSADHARFQFLVYPINTPPELQSDRFALGDTVSGEPMDPLVDVDRFIMHGEAGQEFVAVAEALGPAGSGAVFLNVIDSVTPSFLGYVIAEAGTTTPLTTGRLRVPATQDYQFTLGSVSGNLYPRYRGPYRFWTYLVDRAPEHRGAPIPFNTEIGSERIDRAGDVDEFTFQATAGADFNAFVQASHTVHLEVAPVNGPALAAAVSQASDTALFAHATGRFQIAQSGTYIVRVAGANPHQVADTGGYRFYLSGIDRRPEHVPEAIVPGDTVTGEDIGLPGDVDEFTFSGTVGEEFNAFLQAESGSQETFLQLEAVDAAGTVLRTAQSVGTDTSLLLHPTGRFALSSTGTYRLRVRNASDFMDRSQGPYRLFLYRVNRDPESVPGTLSFGDSLSGESIDVPGDVDEFRVTVPDTSGANLVVELGAQPAEGTLLSFRLFKWSTGDTATAATIFTPGVRSAGGRVVLSPGTYTLRVDVSHYQDRPTLRAPYRIWLYRFGLDPEMASDTFAIGDTVSAESIEPWGDADIFRFYGLRGQHINIALQGRADTAEGWFQAWLTGPGDAQYWTFASVSSRASAPTLRDHQTQRLDLPVTGWYQVEMTGFASTRGAYRLLVESLGTAPEQGSHTLVPGDSVTTESIDAPGDWDEFTVTASPGQDLYLVFRGKSGSSDPFPWVRVSDPVTGDSLAVNVGQAERVVGPFRVPTGGQATIAVYQPAAFVRFCYDATCGGVLSFVGPYAFRVVPLNRAPETAPAAVTVGDTVRGEELTPIGDLDEFTTSATPGITLTLRARLLANPVPTGGIIWLDVLDPATGTVLSTGSGLIGGSPISPFSSLASVVVPASGSVLFRFRGYSNWGDELATAPYEFFVQP